MMNDSRVDGLLQVNDSTDDEDTPDSLDFALLPADKEASRQTRSCDPFTPASTTVKNDSPSE